MMARSRKIDGTYEFCPRNPIISHRHLSLEHEISVTGHADIVKTQNDEWWMVLLAVRPYKHAHFNLGRETFLVPVLWDSDGWLRIDTENGLVNTQERRPNLPYDTGKPEFYSDNFECTELSMIWNSIHPYPVHLFSLTERPGCLRLYLCPENWKKFVRLLFSGDDNNTKFSYAGCNGFSPSSDHEDAGLALVQDDRFHYTFTVSLKHSQRILRVQKCTIMM